MRAMRDGFMASSEDTEITLGTGKLLFLFFGLVGVCALFFGLGYSLGRKSESSLATNSSPAAPQVSSNTNKAGSGVASNPAQPLTFYKSVEQKDANAELTPPTNSKTDTNAAAPTNGTTSAGTASPTANASESSATLPTSGYFVQVAAVSKQEDAQALVDALKSKEYPAFVAPQASTDKLFRVQLGPFADVKDAEAMRTRLIGDGYSPILKK
jgi:cell division septation protein DedD